MTLTNEASVRTTAMEFLLAEITPKSGEELVITHLAEYQYCWLVMYNTRRYAETGNYRFALAGNGPLIINRRTGRLRQGVAGRPVEDQLDKE